MCHQEFEYPLWIRANVVDIKENNEILIHYGVDYAGFLQTKTVFVIDVEGKSDKIYLFKDYRLYYNQKQL